MTTRVGFFLTPTMGWLGGINYFKNLFSAVSVADNAQIELYVVVPSNVDRAALDMMLSNVSNVTVVRTSLLQQGHPWWLAWRVFRKLFNSELAARILVRRHRLDVVSHSEFVRGSGARIVNWLPDFQHIHLPRMFDTSELKSRNSRYANLARHSDRIVVSSEDGLRDLVSTVPDAAPKACVLSFVSAVPQKYWSLDESDHARLLERYRLERDFFYVPNQFWQHKNHAILLDAIKLAKARNLRFQIACSGATHDPRSPAHFEQLQRRAVDIGCADDFRILGIIPYEDVFSLVRFSCAVVNPSKFEGWSSTVEECKSVGKRMLLSNIAVHREQMPQASFFDPDAPEELVELLQKALASRVEASGPSAGERVEANQRRFAEYGARYLEIVREACDQPRTSPDRR
jgi:glycosyltransferase involved in cell wall biosynthesis